MGDENREKTIALLKGAIKDIDISFDETKNAIDMLERDQNESMCQFAVCVAYPSYIRVKQVIFEMVKKLEGEKK